MSGPGSFWACAVPYPRMFPGERLAIAIEMARERLGGEVAGEIYVHPATAAETTTPEGIEFVSRSETGRFEYWFPTRTVRRS